MSWSADPALTQETWEHLITKAKDQDFLYFFIGFSLNTHSRRILMKLFFDNYDTVRYAMLFRGCSNITFADLLKVRWKCYAQVPSAGKSYTTSQCHLW